MALSFGLVISVSYAKDKDADDNELLRRSQLEEPPRFNSEKTSFPRSFNVKGQWDDPRNAAASTGYYWIDDQEKLNKDLFPGMQPSFGRADTFYQPETWRKIVSGPRILPKSHWDMNKQEGLPFFRQPYDGDFWTNPTDSTDDAIAGPIPLGIRGGFYFNGLRYDSFYVSTNGVVALTNRRYFYDVNGNRVIPPGAKNCYDPMSMDWFAGGIRGRDTLMIRTWNNTQDSITPAGKRIPDLDGNGLVQYKNGLNDPAPDNFGYQYAVLGYNPLAFTTNPGVFGGIRSRNAAGDLISAIPLTSKTALIAPFWGDMVLSQYDPELKQRDAHGNVQYKRTYTNDSLIIAFFRIQPKGTLGTFAGPVPVDPDSRPNRRNYVTADAHIVLSTIDSSITIHYSRLTYTLTHNGNTVIYNGPVPAHAVFRWNSAGGVRGFARHINYGKGGIPNDDPWSGEYVQATTWFQRMQDNPPDARVEYPQTGSVVKYKQWQNTLRVHEIAYRVRSKDPKASNPTAFVTDIKAADAVDYELLAGHERLGAIQPVVLIQNLTNEIQGPGGVNFVKQDLKFRGRFQIRNNITNRIIYNRLVPVDELCLGLTEDPEDAAKCNGDPSVKVRLANYAAPAYTALSIFNNFQSTGFNGVPPYYFVQIHFPPFEPNEFIDNHIGRMRSFVIAEPINPASGEKLRDNWPFDDTTKITLFVMRRFYDDHPVVAYRQFEDDGTLWHVDTESGDNIPSAWKWVSINAEMVAGTDVSMYPLAPRGAIANENNQIDKGFGTGQKRILVDPVIRMNRLQMNGIDEPLPQYQDARSPKRGGDEIRSFPIDLRGKQNPVLSISIQRHTKKDDWERGYSDRSKVGPEPRVVYKDNAFAPITGGVASAPDEICVEFAKPSDDEIDRITNIKLADWRHLPFRRGAKAAALSDQAPLTLYGAGGYLIAFLETDKDSTLALPDLGNRRFNSLRYNVFDDGVDFEYQKFAIPIPDTFILWKNQGAKYFRFRVKVLATDHPKACATCITDDADDFYVDNIKILYRAEITDIEVSSVKVAWPYTLVPASQATSIPVTVRVSNNTDIEASYLSVKLKIFRTNGNGDITDPDPIYCRTQAVSNLVRRGTIDQIMPAWNARKSLTDTVGFFKLVAMIFMNEPDLVPRNDTTYTNFTLRVGRSFAYDPAVAEPSNSGMLGAAGLNFLLPTLPASGQPRSGPAWDGVLDTRGAVGGTGSGSVAIRFNLLNSDTLRGFSVLWGALNQSSDQVSMALYEGGERLPIVSNRRINAITTRGGPNLQNVYGRYVDYLFNQPIVLQKGVYWIGISQDGETGMELGASGSRGGMRTTNTWVSNAGNWGESGISLSVDKNFRKVVQGNLINDNFFAFQNVTGSMDWVEFTPSYGNVAFGHHNHYGAGPASDGVTQTLTRGFWVPMIRPYFGAKGFGEAVDEHQWCPDDIPVELYTFTGNVRPTGIDLYWETASEVNNYGFYVERRNAESSDEFKQIGYVAGVGNSSTISRYNFLDKDVRVKTTYEYRLRQMDKDGTQECYTSNVVTLTYDKIGDLTLEQNSPNPFVNNTLISFNVPQAQNVKLEVIDLFGNVVRVLANEFMPAQAHSYTFDGNDVSGNPLPSGSYIYRLSSENNVLTGKMSIVR